MKFSLSLPFLAAVQATTLRGSKPVFDYAKYSNKVDLAEEATPVKFNYAKYAIKKDSESVDFAEEEEEMPLIFSQAKFEDSGIDFAEEGYDLDFAEEEEDKPVFNYAKYAVKKNSDSVDFAEEEEEMPLIFSQAKFEDSGIDFAEEGYDFDLAEEEEKPVFNYA